MSRSTNKKKKMTYLTEKIETYDNPNHGAHGSEILTITLWADDERVQNFGGHLFQDAEGIREAAAAAANKWSGLTGNDVRHYDAFVREMDTKNWEV